ncbi:MAG: hypothetical protein WBF81_09500 [Thermoplasmata archaeon]
MKPHKASPVDCLECGSPLALGARKCLICGATFGPSWPLPDDRVAGETELEIDDVELHSRKVLRFTKDGSAPAVDPELVQLW